MIKPIFKHNCYPFVLLGVCLLPNLTCAQEVLKDDFESYAIASGWHGKPNTKIVEDPSGEKSGKVLQITMPKGKGPGITNKISLKNPAQSACLSYELYLAPGFEFEISRKRGKLPGLAGGDTPTGCKTADAGFSNRFHWIENGTLTQYQYFPGKTTSCGTHTTVGKLTVGKWHTLRSCVNLGTAGKANGTWQTWVDGKSTGEQTIRWRNSNDITINSVLFHAFYSHDKPSKDVAIYFDNLKVVEDTVTTTNKAPLSAPSSPLNVEAKVDN
jgi:hypothetical protein